MSKSEFRKKRYDKFCWQVYRGDDLAGLIEEFGDGRWGVYGLGGSGRVTEARFASVSDAMDWLRLNPERLPI
jgi:hypothetical protein